MAILHPLDVESLVEPDRPLRSFSGPRRDAALCGDGAGKLSVDPHPFLKNPCDRLDSTPLKDSFPEALRPGAATPFRSLHLDRVSRGEAGRGAMKSARPASFTDPRSALDRSVPSPFSECCRTPSVTTSHRPFHRPAVRIRHSVSVNVSGLPNRPPSAQLHAAIIRPLAADAKPPSGPVAVGRLGRSAALSGAEPEAWSYLRPLPIARAKRASVLRL